MYKVIEKFKDTETNKIYEIDEGYPAEGFEVPEERLEYLSTNINTLGKPFIVLVEDNITFDIEAAKEFAADKNIDIGNSTSFNGIAKKIKEAGFEYPLVE